MRTWVLILLISLFLVVALPILIVYTYWDDVFYPAWLSVGSNCFVDGVDTTGYVKSGTFSVDANGTQSIELYVNDPQILKHEQCHQMQYERNRSHFCENIYLFYIDEVECYIRQKF